MQANSNISKKYEKKKKIIETAYQLFRTNSVGATAIDDVVKAAGIARGTFYLYFKDKSDLLEQLIMYKSTETMMDLLKHASENAAKSTAKSTEDAIESFRVFIDMYIDFLISHKDVLMIVTKNISSCLKQLPEFYDREVEKTYKNIVNIFVDAGYTEENANKIIYIVVDMVGSVCSDAILYGHPFKIEDIRDCIVDCALCIIRNGNKGVSKDEEDHQ